MIQYEYPIMSGLAWNAMQKIAIALALPLDSVSVSANTQKTYIGVPNELTPAQKTTLDGIMNNNPCIIPTNVGKTTYKVPDLWSMRQWFFTNWGITPTMWFEQGNEDGSGECYIYLNFPRTLTTIEKKQIIGVYGSAIRES